MKDNELIQLISDLPKEIRPSEEKVGSTGKFGIKAVLNEFQSIEILHFRVPRINDKQMFEIRQQLDLASAQMGQALVELKRELRRILED